MVTSCTTWECTVTHDTFIQRASPPPPPPPSFFKKFFSFHVMFEDLILVLFNRVRSIEMDLGSAVLCVCLRVAQCERLAAPRKSRPVASVSPLKLFSKMNKGSVHTFLPVWSWFKTIRIKTTQNRVGLSLANQQSGLDTLTRL